MQKHQTVDPEEIKKFEAIASQWWDENGKFKPLHRFNPIRIEYIVNTAIQHFGRAVDTKPLAGLTVLDIGCGGGLLSEALSRLGADVTGIDVSEKNIQVATLHAKNSGVKVSYHVSTAEDFLAKDRHYDIVLCMEVVEHVVDLAGFMKSVCQLTKPSGLLYCATLNRTIKSYLFAIVGAEYVLRWLPVGTHHWHKFLKPSELCALIESGGLRIKELKGFAYNPLTEHWSISANLDVNYVILAQRRGVKRKGEG